MLPCCEVEEIRKEVKGKESELFGALAHGKKKRKEKERLMVSWAGLGGDAFLCSALSSLEYCIQFSLGLLVQKRQGCTEKSPKKGDKDG